MSNIIAFSSGYGLPSTSLFSVTLKEDSEKRRSADHFWDKAIAPPPPAPPAPDTEDRYLESTHSQTKLAWLDADTPALSESEDEGTTHRYFVLPPKKEKRFARERQVAFQSFVSKVESKKPSTVIATEITTHQQISGSNDSQKQGRGSEFTIFNSLRIKSKGATTQAKKLVAVARKRISSKSPEELHPKTWEKFHELYATEQIDVLNPPPPPIGLDNGQLSAAEKQFYMAPRPSNERIRQLFVDRLSMFGQTSFDSLTKAKLRSQKKIELAERLEKEGKLPTSLDQVWLNSSVSSVGDMSIDATNEIMAGVRSGELPPETLEQHPVFRKIVRQCREMFNTAISMLTIMDEDRMIFLAETGIGGVREVPRDVTHCAHTILSGRKGFTILDTHADWRFAEAPAVKYWSSRFYAGVPLMAPNLDGAKESDVAVCPLGTLCVVDTKPREKFGVEERKKLVYMAEYARREIEKWFTRKMAQKMKILEASRDRFLEQVGSEADEPLLCEKAEGQAAAAQYSPTVSSSTPSMSPQRTTSELEGKRSTSSNVLSASSVLDLSRKPPSSAVPLGPGLFDEASPGLNSNSQKVFDLATKFVGETLDLSLVYLIAVVEDGDPEQGRTLILSGYNLPLPLPIFDVGLHLRALRAPEGGLLCQNSSAQESRDVGLISRASAHSDSLVSAMLVGVGTNATSTTGGFVLAGFTSNPKRVFGGEDVQYFKQCANDLKRYTSKLSF